jgi:hypothetical protein
MSNWLSVSKRVDIDISYKCALRCPSCIRQSFFKKNNIPIPGQDMSLEDFEFILDYFTGIQLMGEVSDPTHHPDLYSILKMCIDKGKKTSIHIASTFRKDMNWWIDLFNLTAGKDVTWVFGIDGLPKDSHKYRVNQDGEFLYKVMCKGSSLGANCTWQYIIFNYNEDDISTCRKLALAHGVKFFLIKSNRWHQSKESKSLQPKNPDNYIIRKR